MNLKKEFEKMKEQYVFPGYLLTNDRKKILVYSPLKKELEPIGIYNIKYFRRIYNEVFNAWAFPTKKILTIEQALIIEKQYKQE